MEAEDFATQPVAGWGVRGRGGEPLIWVNTIRFKNRHWKNKRETVVLCSSFQSNEISRLGHQLFSTFQYYHLHTVKMALDPHLKHQVSDTKTSAVTSTVCAMDLGSTYCNIWECQKTTLSDVNLQFLCDGYLRSSSPVDWSANTSGDRQKHINFKVPYLQV